MKTQSYDLRTYVLFLAIVLSASFAACSAAEDRTGRVLENANDAIQSVDEEDTIWHDDD